MYSVRHFSCYFICNYFVAEDYIDLEPVKMDFASEYKRNRKIDLRKMVQVN